MNGHVFQLPSERTKRGQFRETIKALKTLASIEYKKDILYLDPLFRKLEDPVIERPSKPQPESVKSEDGTVEDITDSVEMDIYKEEVRDHVRKKERLKQAKSSLFIVVLGQCSDAMTNKLKGVKGYNDMEKNCDVAALLRAVRDLSNKVEEKVSPYETLDDLKKQFYLYRQQPGEDNATHLMKFKDLVEILEQFGSSCFTDSALVEEEEKKEKNKERGIGECEKISREKYLAVSFLRRADLGRYGPLVRELRDGKLHGMDLYPKTLDAAYTLLENHSSGKRRQHNNQDRNKENRSDMVTGIQHAHRSNEEPNPGADGRLNPKVLYFKC